MNTLKTLSAALSMAVVALSAIAQQAPPPPSAEALFDPIGAVLQNPRCLNCHMVERPFQKDVQVPHAQRVIRGADGHGAPTMQCAGCHQSQNSADGKVPGAAHWHLAPLGMAWQGLSRADICRVITDPSKNGNRKTPEQIIDHMKVDPLVLWAWNPGAGRSTPSVSHAQFVKDLEAWAAAGAGCPGGGGAQKTAAQ